ncbi:alpha-amylase family protein [Cellulomonas composti]|uniref:Alpha-amylase n=1 Tax=Cellulomonas composti TaxID=266130 RepID=A0A511JBE7_9CELL|nr:alpha-amylase family protein [Cellulomonas composti]GEL95305.1 alpha-amylase [Cellulomonas composti]
MDSEHAIWWQVYPLGVSGAVGARPPDRPAAPDALRRLVDWLDYARDLGASGLALGPVFASSTHGYDTVDHLAIDPRLGTRADFDELLAQAHARGLGILLDGVFNHVGREHPLFTEALAGGPEQRLFRLHRDGAEVTWDCFEGHRDLVTLNHDEPAVADLVADVMTAWLDAGVDGWRLDAAYAVPPAFWAPVLDRVRARHPHAYVVGEVIHGEYAAFVESGHLDAVTQYELWKAIWSSLLDTNLWELAHALGRHDALVESFAPWTFVGNHDVTRLATTLDDALIGHALVVLLTVAGTPAVYYGDEQAFRGAKEERVGGDDAVRPPLPATPAGLDPDGWWCYHLHQELIGLRRRHPWLHRARTRVLVTENTHLLYESSAAGERLLVALNLADEPWPLPAEAAGAAVVAGHADAGVVPARGWAVLAPAD